MPLNIVEIEKPKERVEFFVTDTKVRPLELEGEILPELIRRCGDVKSGRLTLQMVEQYLDKNVLVFDRDLLKNLFQEADFKKEGSLDAYALKAALANRFPKRNYPREWRQLVAMILNVPELILAEDVKHVKTFSGTFNKDSVWDSAPKELPKVRPQVRRRKSKSGSGSDQSPAATAGPVTGAWATTTAQLSATGALSDTAGSAGSPGATLCTPEGLKPTAPIAAEQKVNSKGLLPGISGTGNAQSTFAAKQEFDKFSRGLETMSDVALDPRTVRSFMGKPSVRAWSAALPPTAITLPPSALQTLRGTVRSTMAHKPEFLTMHRTLTTAELDNKKVLGQQMDVTASLARVEPVRPTKVLYNASYEKWADYASNCRTAPTRWYNEHPAAPAPPAEHKYPWG